MKLLLTSSGISNSSIHSALVDLLGKPEQTPARLVRGGHPGHVDGLGVVGDHPLHEPDVGLGVARALGDDDRRTVIVLSPGGSGDDRPRGGPGQ